MIYIFFDVKKFLDCFFISIKKMNVHRLLKLFKKWVACSKATSEKAISNIIFDTSPRKKFL